MDQRIAYELVSRLRSGVEVEELAAIEYPGDSGAQALIYVSAELTVPGGRSLATWVVDEADSRIFSANLDAQLVSDWPRAAADAMSVERSQECVA